MYPSLFLDTAYTLPAQWCSPYNLSRGMYSSAATRLEKWDMGSTFCCLYSPLFGQMGRLSEKQMNMAGSRKMTSKPLMAILTSIKLSRSFQWSSLTQTYYLPCDLGSICDSFLFILISQQLGSYLQSRYTVFTPCDLLFTQIAIFLDCIAITQADFTAISKSSPRQTIMAGWKKLSFDLAAMALLSLLLLPILQLDPSTFFYSSLISSKFQLCSLESWRYSSLMGWLYVLAQTVFLILVLLLYGSFCCLLCILLMSFSLQLVWQGEQGGSSMSSSQMVGACWNQCSRGKLLTESSFSRVFYECSPSICLHNYWMRYSYSLFYICSTSILNLFSTSFSYNSFRSRCTSASSALFSSPLLLTTAGEQTLRGSGCLTGNFLGAQGMPYNRLLKPSLDCAIYLFFASKQLCINYLGSFCCELTKDDCLFSILPLSPASFTACGQRLGLKFYCTISFIQAWILGFLKPCFLASSMMSTTALNFS